jgi:uncharacterized protein
MIPRKKNFHIFYYKKEPLLFDTSSNTILRINPSFSNFLLGISDQDSHEHEKNKTLLNQLQNTGICNPAFNKEEEGYIAPIYKLSLEVFSGCNMRCLYCYAHIWQKKEEKPIKASFEQIKKSIDFFIFEFGKYAKAYEVNIVGGGEPLINFNLIKEIRNYCDELEKVTNKKIVFWVFTNGTVFTKEIINYFIQKRQSLTISLDGPAEIQNYLRPLGSGLGSYKIIEKWIKFIKETARGKSGIENFWVSTVITTRHNNLIELLLLFKKLGIKKAQIRPIRTKNEDLVFGIVDLRRLKHLYNELVNYLVEDVKDLHFELLNIILNDRDYLGRQIIRILLRQHVTYRCGASKSKLSIRANGNIYPCDIGSDIDKLKLGNITNYNLDNKYYFQLHTDKKPICMDCWCRYLCGGGCYIAAYERTGDINSPDFIECEFTKIVIESAISFIYEITRINPSALDKIRKYVLLQEKILDNVYGIK